MIAWLTRLVAGSFLSSWLASFFLKRQLTKQARLEDAPTINRLATQNAEMTTQIKAVEEAHAVRDQINAGKLPADVDVRVRAQYVD